MKLVVCILALITGNAFAGTPKFDAITGGDFDSIMREVSANFRYTTVSGATTLGKIFGFEFGAVVGRTDIPDTYSIVKRTDPSVSMDDWFPHANLLARVSVPYGITVEAAAIPSKKIGDIKFSQFGGGLLWTFSDVLLDDFPVTMGVRGFYKTTKFTFSQTIQNSSTANQAVGADIALTSKIYGGQFAVSKKFFGFLEPFAVLGYNRSTGKLAVNAAPVNGNLPTIFAASLTTGNSATAKHDGLEYRGGLDLQLLFLSLGAEYAKLFGTEAYTGRLSFRF